MTFVGGAAEHLWTSVSALITEFQGPTQAPSSGAGSSGSEGMVSQVGRHSWGEKGGSCLAVIEFYNMP